VASVTSYDGFLVCTFAGWQWYTQAKSQQPDRQAAFTTVCWNNHHTLPSSSSLA